MPRDAAVVAYADVREIMISDVRQKIRRVVPAVGRMGSASSRTRPASTSNPTSISVVASLQPLPDGKTAGLVVARGRFNEVKIEALMREHGAQVEDYNGKRVIENRQRAADRSAIRWR